MARRIVLHISGRPVDGHGKRQDILHDADVPSTVHGLASLEKADTTSSVGREASPDHDTCKEREKNKKQKHIKTIVIKKIEKYPKRYKKTLIKSKL